jgi:acetyl-CoA carboxylase carboxyltransferase component
MDQITSRFRMDSPQAQQNFKAMETLCQELATANHEAAVEGSEKYLQRHKERGKNLARERISTLLDRGSPFLELMPLAGWGQEEMTLGGSVIVGLGVVSGVLCLVHANVPTQKGGALNEISVLKTHRMDDIARQNQLPVIYLTESAGGDLSQQAKVFNSGGRAFREITRRSKQGIPSITVVFGSSTAGGAYVPGMSDYVVMVDKNAKTYLAGPPLVKMALGEEVDDETLGGARMHATRSGLADYLAESEEQGIGIAREILRQYPWLTLASLSKHSQQVKPPLYPAQDLLGLISPDPKAGLDAREVIARLVDGSEFFEFKPLYGETLVTGFATLGGHPIGILANNGVLFSDSANKGAHFIQLCQKQKRPLLFLQNITGFMVGKEAENSGIIKNGAKLINAVSNAEVPCLTVMIGNSFGAGNYGMCGRAFDPRFLFSWPNSRLAVMGAEQLVGVLEIVQQQKAQTSGLSLKSLLDKGKNLALKEGLRRKIDEESSAYYSTSRLWDDGIIDPRQTREVLQLCLAAVTQKKDLQEGEWGVFRM